MNIIKSKKQPGLFFILLSFILIIAGLSACSDSSEELEDRDTLFQISTLNTLMEGNYDGFMTYKMLKKHGDFGIGTFDTLDGEMIALDGKFFQIPDDMTVYLVGDSATAPFAAVTFFEADKTESLDQAMDYTELKQYIDTLLPSEDLFYAIKIEGTFQYMQERSVPSQDKPYPPLEEVIEDQTIRELENVEGTMVGLWCPEDAGGINAAGYHFHFIDVDRETGGHVLECTIDNVEIEIDYTYELRMVLPEE